MNETDMQAAQRVINGWVETVNSNDRVRLMSLVADDLEMIPPGELPAKGADAHRLLGGFFDTFTLALETPTLEVVVSGDWAFRRYAYKLTLTPKAGGDVVTHQGQGVHMLHRERNGSWRVAKDIWN